MPDAAAAADTAASTASTATPMATTASTATATGTGTGTGTGTYCLGDEMYGLLEVAGIDVALPLSVLREVVACPPTLAALPATAQGLLGALELRSAVVPVLDLRPCLALPAERTDTQAVVVLASRDHGAGGTGGSPLVALDRAGTQVLGLLVDQVHGIVGVPAQDLLTISAAISTQGSAAAAHPASGPASLFKQAFRHPGTGTAVSVLDPGRLLSLPGLPHLRQAGPAHGTTSAGAANADPTPDHRAETPPSSDGAVRAAAAPTETLTVLRCGAYLLALQVDHVHTTVPSAAPRPSVLTGPLCRGVTPYRDREIPVVDMLALLGLSSTPSEVRTGAGLVLEIDGGYVTFDLDSLQDLVRIDPAQIVPLPAVAVERPELLRGIIELDGLGTCLVLDGPALQAEATLSALSRMNTDMMTTHSPMPDAAVADANSRAPAGNTAHSPLTAPEYLVYSSGGSDLVTPLEQISEIIPMPGQLTVTGSGALGVTVHRGQAVPVVSLADALGLPTPPSAGCLLLITASGFVLALAVDGLHSIARLSWSDDAPCPEPAGPPLAGLRGRRLVTVGQDGRLLPEVDLREVSRQVHSNARLSTAAQKSNSGDGVGREGVL